MAWYIFQQVSVPCLWISHPMTAETVLLLKVPIASLTVSNMHINHQCRLTTHAVSAWMSSSVWTSTKSSSVQTPTESLVKYTLPILTDRIGASLRSSSHSTIIAVPSCSCNGMNVKFCSNLKQVEFCSNLDQKTHCQSRRIESLSISSPFGPSPDAMFTCSQPCCAWVLVSCHDSWK